MIEFTGFPKMSRLSRECFITEKIDGTNAQLLITDNNELYIGSRTKWLYTPQGMTGPDNFGFAQWALSHKEELITGLGIGQHFGEWWGQGIQRGYGLKEKRFSLFNVSVWGDDSVRPSCCNVVPVLYQGMFDTGVITTTLELLRLRGSVASPGFMKPEGVVVFHTASSSFFKKTLDNDSVPKGMLL